MSRRQLLGVAAAVAIIAAALWYVGLAPAWGSGVEPASSVRVAVSATAAGSGSWVRYLVTVKDLADGNFAGDVLLLDQDQGSEQQPQAAASLPSLSQSPRVPTAPAVAGESAYRVPLRVASRTSRTIAILAPAFFNVIEAVMGGTLLDSETVDHTPVLPVAVLSDVVGPADTILGLRYGQLVPRVAQFASARDFPTSALPLAGYTTLVIDQFDSATLGRPQLQALRDFVGFGGTLVLAGGSAWRRTLAPLPADLVPIRATTTATVALDPVAALTATDAPPRAVPAALGSLAAGARSVLDGAGGVPLVAELAYGAGKVVELAYDPGGDGTPGTPYASLGWSQAIGRSILQSSGGGPAATSVLGPDPAFTALLPAAGDAPLPALWLVALVLVLYVVLVAPVGYLLVLRRWRRPVLFWATVPAVSVVFTGLLYLAGSSLQGSLVDHEIQVIRAGPSAVNVLEYHRVLFLRRGNHQVVPPAGTLVAPLTLETYRTTGSTCERCTNQLGGLPSGSEDVLPSQQPTVSESGVEYGSVRVVAASGMARAQLGLDARLKLSGGRLQGTIANPGRQAVYQLELFSSDGQTAHMAPMTAYLPPGARVAVDAALGTPGSPSSASAVALLLQSVASTAVSGNGQAVLVGLTAPLPSRLTVDGQQPPLASLAVLQQTVGLTGADGSLHDFEHKWLAGSAGDPQHGFTDVYDLEVPPPAGALTLTYAQAAGAVELWDWGRNAFVPVGGQPGRGPTAVAALTADQVRDGLVRVRVHEPEPSWAGGLWVDAA